MMAEVISQNFPKMIEVHNYPATSSLKSKLANWTTLSSRNMLIKIKYFVDLELF